MNNLDNNIANVPVESSNSKPPFLLVLLIMLGQPEIVMHYDSPQNFIFSSLSAGRKIRGAYQNANSGSDSFRGHFSLFTFPFSHSLPNNSLSFLGTPVHQSIS